MAASAVLVTLISGQRTVTEALAELFPVALAASLVAVAEAVFETLPQFVAEVVAST